jgi:DNA-binding HxlR family transcriptional regulator
VGVMDDFERLPDGDFEHLERTVRILGKRWAIPIMHELNTSPRERAGFSELRGRLGGVSAKVLSERLREMVELDLLKRRVNVNLTPMRVNYKLTKKGTMACQVLNGLMDCAMG